MGCGASRPEDKVQGNLGKMVIEEVKNGKKKEKVQHNIMGKEKEEKNTVLKKVSTDLS